MSSVFKWLTEIKENSASAIQSGKLWIKWNHVLENSMMQNNPNIAIIVWGDAEIIALWEPILPGMRQKYFGELPQITFFARVYWALWCYLKNLPAPTRTKYARTLSARNHRFRFALCDELWLHILIALVQKLGCSVSVCSHACVCPQ